MTSLTELHQTREQTISSHYAAALAELTDKVKASPLKTEFHVYSGCVSKDIAQELAFRFNQDPQISAQVDSYGWFITTYYLTVKYNLPLSLVHAENPITSETSETKESTVSLPSESLEQTTETKELSQSEMSDSPIKESINALKAKAVIKKEFKEFKELVDTAVQELNSSESRPAKKIALQRL